MNSRSSRQFFALGTASQVPTRNRNHNGYFLKWDDEGFLFDPGEGTQRQMLFAGVSATEITKIFITHFHGDHCLGLPGVLQRLSLDRVTYPVDVYFPASGSRYFENLRQASIYFDGAIIRPHPIEQAGVLFENERLTISTQQLDHTVESWGYRIEEPDSVSMLPEKLKELGIRGEAVGMLKRDGCLQLSDRLVNVEDVSMPKQGQSFAFVMDTRYCEAAVSLAADTDILVAESTFLNEHAKEADAHGHLTATDAATIAHEASVEQLVLTHFSQRYGETDAFVSEARAIFPNVVAMNDGDSIRLGVVKQ